MNGSRSRLLRARPRKGCSMVAPSMRKPCSVKSSLRILGSQGPVEAGEDVRTVVNCREEGRLSLLKTLSGSIDDEVRRGSAEQRAGQAVGSADGPANPCRGTDAFGVRCNSRRRPQEFGAERSSRSATALARSSPCTWRPSTARPRSRASAVRHGCAAHPTADWPGSSLGSGGGSPAEPSADRPESATSSANTVGSPSDAIEQPRGTMSCPEPECGEHRWTGSAFRGPLCVAGCVSF